MTPLSYHSSNLSLIALEAMRLLVLIQENEIYTQNLIFNLRRIQSPSANKLNTVPAIFTFSNIVF